MSEIQYNCQQVVGSTSASFSATNGGASGLVIGNAVYFDSVGDAIKAQADADVSALGIGFATSTIDSAADGNFQLDGVMVATEAEWNAVTEEGSGGLTEGARYFISEITAGKITTTAPSSVGETVVQIGVALSSTRLKITDTLQVKL